MKSHRRAFAALLLTLLLAATVPRAPATQAAEPASGDAWAVLPPLREARTSHTATTLTDGRVLVTGGESEAGLVTAAALYDPASDSWTTSEPPAALRDRGAGLLSKDQLLLGQRAALLTDGRVLLAGGGTGQRAAGLYAEAADPAWCPAETGHCLRGHFLGHWHQHGGLAVNGFPLSPAFAQRLEDGNEYTVQYFERVRMELHPEHPAPNDVLLGQFGRRIVAGVPGAPTEPMPPMAGFAHFPETRHNVAPRFLGYWERNGGLAQFGYPLTEEFTETLEDGKAYTVQYFERARLEWHPEHVGAPHEVLLGQFGRRILAEPTRPADREKVGE